MWLGFVNGVVGRNAVDALTIYDLYTFSTGLNKSEIVFFFNHSVSDQSLFNKNVSTTIKNYSSLKGSQPYYLTSLFIFLDVKSNGTSTNMDVDNNYIKGVAYVHLMATIEDLLSIANQTLDEILSLTVLDMVRTYHGLNASDFTMIHNVTDEEIGRLEVVNISSIFDIGVIKEKTRIDELWRLAISLGKF